MKERGLQISIPLRFNYNLKMSREEQSNINFNSTKVQL